MHKKIIFILLMVSGFSPFIYAVSFDCSKAGTDVEHLICDNAELSLLDETLADRYKQAMEYSVSKNNIKKRQFKWLSRRNKCIEVSCLITSYESMIKSLEGSINVFQKRLNIENQINNLVFDDSYKNFDIQKSMGENYSRSIVRPKNMYQLIASADNFICNNVLSVLNQPGTYQGDDQVYWWVSNNSLAKWNVIREGYNPSKSYSHSQIEEFIGDIDGDLLPEFTYRVQGNFSSNYYQSIAIFESSLNKASVTSEKSSVCQGLDKAECNGIKPPPLDELYKNIWEMVSAPYSSIDGKWKSGINGGKGIYFLKRYFSHLNESSKYYSSWWSNLINVEGKYGLILYPPGMEKFRVIFGVLSKDDIIQYQCVFAPKQ